MKLDAAKAVIKAAPNTHLASAARAVLALLEAMEADRVGELEGELERKAEELRIAREEAEALDAHVATLRHMADEWQSDYTQSQQMLKIACESRDELAKQLEERAQPDPDLMRLRALEHACCLIRDAQPPRRVEGRATYDKLVSLIVPHLTPK